MELKIKSCLSFIKYIDLSQEIIDEICTFIFKYEFREIYIDNKVLFFDSQIYLHKKYSDITRKVISDKLFYYMDMHINSIQDGKPFEFISTHTGINYSNLIYYIDPNDKTISTSRLSIRISRILKNEYKQMYKSVCDYYFTYLSSNQKNKIIKLIKSSLQAKFDFELFAVLIQEKVKIDKTIIELLNKYLRQKCNTSENIQGVQIYLNIDKYNDLKNVGY